MGNRIPLVPPTTEGLAMRVLQGLLPSLDVSVKRESVKAGLATATHETMRHLASIMEGSFELNGVMHARWRDNLPSESKELKSAALHLENSEADFSLIFGSGWIELRQWKGDYRFQGGVSLRGVHLEPTDREQPLPDGVTARLSPLATAGLNIRQVGDATERAILLSEIIAALPEGLSADGSVTGSFTVLDRLERDHQITVTRRGLDRKLRGVLTIRDEQQLWSILEVVERDSEASGFFDVVTHVKEGAARLPSEIGIRWAKETGKPAGLELASIDPIPKNWRARVKEEVQSLLP